MNAGADRADRADGGTPAEGAAGRAAGAGTEPPYSRGQAAAAVAIVVAALMGLLLWQRTVGDTAASGPTQLGSAAGGSAPRATVSPTPFYGRLTDVAWPRVDYPMACPGVGFDVLDVEYGDLTSDGESEALVHVRCGSGAGSPPSALYVYDRPERGVPQLVAALLGPSSGVLVDRIGVEPGGISASGVSYSSSDVPRCCPDETFDARWRWTGEGFDRVA
ncbi:MAG: hypothetical protein ACRDPK_11675 [Carbonactinosporaceae bacterium]